MPLWSQTPFYPESAFSDLLDFGSYFSMSGNRFVAGAGSGWTQTNGKPYLFELQDGEVHEIFPFIPAEGVYYPNPVTLFGNQAAAYNPLYVEGSDEPVHQIVVYAETENGWQPAQTITVGSNDYLTRPFLTNGFLFVGAPGDENDTMPGDTNTGSVYVYTFNGDQWEFFQKLELPETSYFGARMIRDGNRIAITSNDAQSPNPNIQYIHVFELVDNIWQHSGSAQPMGISYFDFANDELYVMYTNWPAAPVCTVLNQQNSNWEISQTVALNFQNESPLDATIEVGGENMFIGGMEPVLHYVRANGIWNYANAIYDATPGVESDSFGHSLAFDGNLLLLSSGEFPQRAYYLDIGQLSSDEYRKSLVDFYPNPTDGVLLIQNALHDPITEIKIHSVTGQLLHTQKADGDRILMSALPGGVYFVSAIFPDGSKRTKRIIRE